MAKSFGTLPNGQSASLYTISCGSITAEISDYGATLVRLWVPNKDGVLADVAPSILHIMGLGQPEEMTGKCLIKD